MKTYKSTWVLHLPNDKTDPLPEDLPPPKSTEQDKETFKIPGNLLLSQHMLNKTLLSNREKGWINITTSPHSN